MQNFKQLFFKTILVVAFFLGVMNADGQVMTVNGSSTPEQLVNLLLGTGASVVPGSVLYTGSLNGIGTFSGSGIGLASGVILSSGDINLAPGLDNTCSASGVNNATGDAQLDVLSGYPTFDAAVLEFDFIPLYHSINFRYVFASEEYSEWVNSPYNDVFAFFISGPGITGAPNIATLPNSVPVSINTLNNGYTVCGDIPIGPCTNCTYFIDNTNGLYMQFDGYTVPLSAGANVIPGQVYHIKIAIADASDFVYDSGVMLEQGSFGSPTCNINVISSNPLCSGGTATLDAGFGSHYLWNTGDTTQVITVSTTGQYCVTVTDNGGNSCSACRNITVSSALAPHPVITSSGATSFCGGGSVTLDAGGPYTSYLWSNGSTTQTTIATQTGNYVVTVTGNGGCTGTAGIHVDASQASPALYTNTPTSFCGCNNVYLDAGYYVSYASYLWSTGETTSYINPMVCSNTTFSVTVTDFAGCTGTAFHNITTTVGVDPIIVPDGPTTFCNGGSVNLDAGAFASYHWNTGATTEIIHVTTSGTYTVTVYDANGCMGISQPITVSSTGNINPVIHVYGATTLCEEASMYLDAGPGYTYNWSDGDDHQIIEVTHPGTYSVTITDITGCSGVTSVNITAGMFHQPSITALGPTTFCHGNNVTLDAGVHVTYSGYHWSTGATTQTITVYSSGTYYVTATDVHGCTGVNSILITVNANPTPTINSLGNPNLCEGSNVWLDGGTWESYQWSTGESTELINVATTGYYCLTITDANNCSGLACIDIHVNPNPTPVIISNEPTIFCEGGLVSLDAGSYASYTWSTGDTTETIFVNSSGTYFVTVGDANDCTGTTSIDVTESTAIVYITDANFKAALLADPTINTNVDSEIQVCEAAAFTDTMYVGNLSIYDLTGIEAFTALTGLYCDSNNLSSLDVSLNTVLMLLNCSNNALISLDVSHNSQLSSLLCNSNNLSSLNVANGNNTNFINFSAVNNPTLTCIQVDNVAWSTANWTVGGGNIDNTASFGLDCNPYRTVNLHLFLEGLFNSNTNLMNEAMDGNTGGPQWGLGISDKIQVDLFDENAAYAPIGVSISGVNVAPDGLATFDVSSSLSANYFIRVSTRNHLSTWSSISVPFNTNPVVYDFTSDMMQAYGIDAQVQVAPNKYAFFLGDLDQGGWVDSDDFNLFEPDLTMGVTGFYSSDFNGGGWVDSDDFNMFEPRLTMGVSSQWPGAK